MRFLTHIITGTFLVLGIVSSISFDTRTKGLETATEKCAAVYLDALKKFDDLLVAYPNYFSDSSYASRLYRYEELLYQYKQIECLYSFYYPKETYETFLTTPRFLTRDFGPPFPDNWIWAGPFGIDPDSTMRTFSKKDSVFVKQFITRATKNFRSLLAKTAFQSANQRLEEADVFEALRLQLARISTMGIANGDMIIERAGMPGLQGAYDGWATIVKIYADALPQTHHQLKLSLLSEISEGEKLLASKPSFLEFDRLKFLTKHLIPLSKRLNQLQSALGVPRKDQNTAFNRNVNSIYDLDAMDINYFISSPDASLTQAKVELGKFLFFDPILSDNNERACASCHKPERAYTDGKIKSVGFEREKDLARNSPTVINAVFQKQQFWDLRASSLEDQLDSVINNKDELHSSFENVIEKVSSSSQYLAMFRKAFPEIEDDKIQRKHIKIAIASYERTLTALDTRFDKYVRGDETQLSPEEKNGFNIFMGKAKCGTCHFAPLFNGALPPYFDSTEHRSLGVPVKDTMDVYEVDPDTGFSKVSLSGFHHFSFKIPTLRNVEFTAPYMHNGVYKTLEQVIDFYDHAGGINFEKQMRPGMRGLPFFMILPEKLNLTVNEKRDLILFLKSLNDTTSFSNIPQNLPRLGGKFASLNNRKLGGEY